MAFVAWISHNVTKKKGTLMKYLVSLGVLAMSTGGATVEAQVVLPPVTCELKCGETVIYSFTCTRLETCCVLGSCSGEWDGGCCRNSPQWCCVSGIIEGSPVADCFECDPE